MKNTKQFLAMLILIAIFMSGLNPITVEAKIKKPFLALPTFDVKAKTKTSITLDLSSISKYYLKGKNGITGLQIYRKVDKKWKKISTIKVKTKKGKKTIKKTYKDSGLNEGTKYQYRIRTYKVVSGKQGKKKVKKTFYSKYEKLSVTTKKEKNEEKQEDTTNPLLGILFDQNGNYIDPYKHTTNKDYRQKMLASINTLRTKEGLCPLVLNETMCKMTDIRAKEIKELFEHRRPDNSSWDSVFYEFNLDYVSDSGTTMSVRPTGENIGGGAVCGNPYGYVEGEGLYYGVGAEWEDKLNSWLQSEGHRASIMSEFTDQFAVSYFFDEKTGSYYWVQLFGASYEK